MIVTNVNRLIIDDHREWSDPSAHLERHHLSSESACVAGWYVGLMWTPKYLVDVVGVSIEASGFVLLLPYILPAAGTLVGGCERSSLACADLTARCMRVNPNTPDLNTILSLRRGSKTREIFAWQGGATL